MAKLTRDEFISALKEMSILEVNELVEAMKEEFGVDPSAVAVAGPAAAAVEEMKSCGIDLENQIKKMEDNKLKTKYEQFSYLMCGLFAKGLT